MANPPLLFYAYASPDERFAKDLEKHLSLMEREGLFRSWTPRMIKAGENHIAVLEQKLNEAAYILFLISADFFVDCANLIPLALQRHQAKRAQLIPVLVRAVDWKRSPLGALAPCPRNGKAVKSWPDEDEAWLDVVERLRELRDENSAPAPSVPAALAPVLRPEATAYDRKNMPYNGAKNLGMNGPTTGSPIKPRSLRNLLDAVLRTDSDLNAFCLDYFSEIYRQFGSGMDRSTKYTLLLQTADPGEILESLREGYPSQFNKYSHLLNEDRSVA